MSELIYTEVMYRNFGTPMHFKGAPYSDPQVREAVGTVCPTCHHRKTNRDELRALLEELNAFSV